MGRGGCRPTQVVARKRNFTPYYSTALRGNSAFVEQSFFYVALSVTDGETLFLVVFFIFFSSFLPRRFHYYKNKYRVVVLCHHTRFSFVESLVLPSWQVGNSFDIPPTLPSASSSVYRSAYRASKALQSTRKAQLAASSFTLKTSKSMEHTVVSHTNRSTSFCTFGAKFCVFAELEEFFGFFKTFSSFPRYFICSYRKHSSCMSRRHCEKQVQLATQISSSSPIAESRWGGRVA